MTLIEVHLAGGTLLPMRPPKNCFRVNEWSSRRIDSAFLSADTLPSGMSQSTRDDDEKCGGFHAHSLLFPAGNLLPVRPILTA